MRLVIGLNNCISDVFEKVKYLVDPERVDDMEEHDQGAAGLDALQGKHELIANEAC